MRRLARELNQTTAKLASLITSQEQFVADASHELRTPLTALRLRVENGDTDAALGEIERLARLVDELLALARADASGEVPEPLHLDDVVARRVELWAPYASEHGVTLRPLGGGSVVRAAPGRIEQVLDNLLANAIDASPAGSTVTVAASRDELHVSDEGPGLSGEQRARAFDRFWRASASPGSGTRAGNREAARRARRRIDRVACRPVRWHRRGRPVPGRRRVTSGPGPMLGPGGDR